jgi:hypothetical protein
MSYSISITEYTVLQVIRAFLLTLPNINQVIRAQQNRASLPQGPNWIEMTPIMRARLSLNTDTYLVSGTGTTAVTTKSSLATYRQDVQCDVFGPMAGDISQFLSQLWIDPDTIANLTVNGVTPLYATDPRNMQFTNDQQQFEYRFSIDLSAEIDPVITSASQSAGTLTLGGIYSVDATFPPS